MMSQRVGPQGENLVFLMSMPRSGSTVLSMMFSAHTKISCPPEPWMLLFVAECFDLANIRKAPYGRNNAQIAALDFLQGLECNKVGTLEDLINRFAKGFENVNGIECIARELVRNIYDIQLSNSEKNVFIDKTPRNYTILPFIDKIFPLSKKIFLKRNPLDIALSYLTTWNVPIKELTGEILSVNSRDFAEGLFIFSEYFSSPSPLKYVIAYEDLVRECSSQLAKLCKFIGVDFQPSMLKYFEDETIMQKFRDSAVGDPVLAKKHNTISTTSIGRGISKLAPSDLQSLLYLLGGNLFHSLGYSGVINALDAMSIDIPREQTALLNRQVVLDKIHSTKFVENERNTLLGSYIESVVETLRESEADRHDRGAQIETLTKMLEESEQDRVARGKQIETLTRMLKESEVDRGARSEQIETLTQMLKESEVDRGARSEQIETLTQMLKESEADRGAKGVQIEVLTRKLRESEKGRV